MKTPDTNKFAGSQGDATSNARRSKLNSPRAEALKNSQTQKSRSVPGGPFDPQRYREIYSETD